MIFECERPEIMKHLPEYFMYINLQDSIGIYGYMGFHISKDMAGLHCEIIRWNKSVAMQLKKDFDKVKKKLKSIGINKIVASYKEKSEKWEKFIKLYGFPKPELIYMSTLEV